MSSTEPAMSSTEPAMSSPEPAMPSTKPEVVLVGPWKTSSFPRDNEPTLWDALNSKADFKKVVDISEASALFNGNERSTVLVDHPWLVENTRAKERDEVINYVRTGGTLILSGGFASGANLGSVDKLFADLSLPWQFVEYRRKEYIVNTAMTQIDISGLHPSISLKSIQLANVAASDAVYLPDPSSRKEIDDPRQTMAAFGTSGEGKVGYVSDVNDEPETIPIVLAMCGLGGADKEVVPSVGQGQ
ncbi:hypothetical protein PRZ48_001440 [Zasmidium cellare]|uniref:Uncharacterized protein n=1 Tax=Zasmidium cellare TaxID=395010 RepID=A0ABR0F345_ZASCE|nr:hypothetical protein PRZ48_001440 [Zasmidium cellare]